jgi:hypothetical protein
MTSRALIPKLNVLDFRKLKGQSHDKVCLCKICWQPLYDAVVCSKILPIRETGLIHLEYLCLKNLKAVGEP